MTISSRAYDLENNMCNLSHVLKHKQNRPTVENTQKQTGNKDESIYDLERIWEYEFSETLKMVYNNI